MAPHHRIGSMERRFLISVPVLLRKADH